jgi:hypothetical protein
MSPERIEVHLSGSPSVQSVSDVADALHGLVNAIAGHEVKAIKTGRCVCDDCGARSEPMSLDDPAACGATLREAGWIRDTAKARDTCPTCAAKGESS